MKVVVFNLGCKVNQYECDCIIDYLKKLNYDVSSELEYADVYIVNTCAVTSEAERKSRQAISRCKSFNKESKIFVIGCASQYKPESFMKDGVIYIGGTNNKLEIVKHLQDNDLYKSPLILPKKYEPLSLTSTNRTRGYIKIQDGCNKFCSYCIIPFLRGRSHSRKIDDIVKEFDELSKLTNEIVLIGVDLMDFGADTNESLTDLFKELKNYNIRIRLGSLYAELIDEQFLDSVFSLKKFCPHFHLSLQSGDEDILRRMNRHYSVKEYSEKISLIRKYDDLSGITTDVIVGFPTETDDQFNNTYKFLENNEFSDLHLFPYSKREGTLAAKLTQVDKEIVKERMKKLSELKTQLEDNFIEKNLKRPQEILIEYKNDDNLYEGYSRNYIRLYTKYNQNLREINLLNKYKDGMIEI